MSSNLESYDALSRHMPQGTGTGHLQRSLAVVSREEDCLHRNLRALDKLQTHLKLWFNYNMESINFIHSMHLCHTKQWLLARICGTKIIHISIVQFAQKMNNITKLHSDPPLRSLINNVYIYIYICVCVCVPVCAAVCVCPCVLIMPPL